MELSPVPILQGPEAGPEPGSIFALRLLESWGLSSGPESVGNLTSCPALVRARRLGRPTPHLLKPHAPHTGGALACRRGCAVHQAIGPQRGTALPALSLSPSWPLRGLDACSRLPQRPLFPPQGSACLVLWPLGYLSASHHTGALGGPELALGDLYVPSTWPGAWHRTGTP